MEENLPINAEFHVEPSWAVGKKVYINGTGHMTKMAIMPIYSNQSRTNGPINAHLTNAQVMPRYNHNNEKQEALL